MTDSFADYFSQVQATAGWNALLGSFARFAALPPLARVLDVGCGPGSLARRLADEGHTVAGLDSSPDMIAQAKKLSPDTRGISFEVGDALAMRFADDDFDAVLATNVVFLLPDPAAGVREMARVTRQGGVVAMLNPSPKMSVRAAESLADERNLQSFERVSLINWARAAEANRRMDEHAVRALFEGAGLSQTMTAEKVGGGLALLVRGVK